ncbi:lipid-binding protein [Pelobium manganitolerans]|uniref:Lipid-binding protein n=1 Tax=Pelobium manganitolerans TaxID=1842495 RepID=A0A419S9A6_9SPHI|nr:YceI family protein [Pelobium manganitolerans]RKD18328.1 lipid-binding protein [Pelobium manganitolerans]
MKTLSLFLALTISLLAFTAPSDVYTVDTTRSKIEWIGKKVTGAHHGEVALSGGQLVLNGNKLQSGSFDINMNSITVKDLSGTSATKLLGHLKSEDFFDTDKYSNAKFVITKVTPQSNGNALIAGNLTIKGITHPLSFQANIKQKNGLVVAVANGVKVDRTKYEIKYGSSSFLAGLGDKAIDDHFELNINLVAKK